jgi:hypothetical protein
MASTGPTPAPRSRMLGVLSTSHVGRASSFR